MILFCVSFPFTAFILLFFSAFSLIFKLAVLYNFHSFLLFLPAVLFLSLRLFPLVPHIFCSQLLFRCCFPIFSCCFNKYSYVWSATFCFFAVSSPRLQFLAAFVSNFYFLFLLRSRFFLTKRYPCVNIINVWNMNVYKGVDNTYKTDISDLRV